MRYLKIKNALYYTGVLIQINTRDYTVSIISINILQSSALPTNNAKALLSNYANRLH